MEIDKLEIRNFKSLLNISIRKPKSFSVFAGSNASGKSNIFEAMQFANELVDKGKNAASLFGEMNEIVNYNHIGKPVKVTIENLSAKYELEYPFPSEKGFTETTTISRGENSENEFDLFFKGFSRIFVGREELNRYTIKDDSKLNVDCSNIEKVLRRIMQDERKKEEIIDYMQLLVPEFKDIEIVSNDLTGEENILVFEENYAKPFPSHLISDGTHNLLCLLASVYQGNTPQFLCIEEPETGINPKVVKTLIDLFRSKTKEGFLIWLNTHSQTVVSELSLEELIIVDKINGVTRLKQFENFDLHGLRVDEAWLANVLGGGMPW